MSEPDDHPNLSPEINDWLKQMKNSEGFDIKARKKGDMFKVTTRSGSVYTFVVTNPENQEVAMVSPDNRNSKMRKPQLYVIDGATGGGSMVRVGWIGIGSYLRMRRISIGGLYTITPIQFITLRQEPELAAQIVAAAEATRPKAWTEEDKKNAEKKLRELTDEKFPADKIGPVENLINFFCWNGKVMMLTLLIKAQEAGKLDEAFKVISKQIREHWGYRPPEIRGEFITESDVYYMQQAYLELGLQVPQ